MVECEACWHYLNWRGRVAVLRRDWQPLYRECRTMTGMMRTHQSPAWETPWDIIVCGECGVRLYRWPLRQRRPE